MKALYILLMVSAVLGLIAYIPVRIQISANADEQSVVLKYAFLKTVMYPPSSKEKTKKTKETKEQDNKEEKNKGFGFVLGLWGKGKGEIFLFLKRFTAYLVRHGIKIYELNLSGRFGIGDPAYTGILSGAVYSAVYGFTGKLKAKGKLRKYSINITPDFDNECLKLGVYTELRTRFAHCIILFAIALNHGLRLWKIYRKARKEYENG